MMGFSHKYTASFFSFDIGLWSWLLTESFQHNEHRFVENLLCVLSSFALFLHQGSFSGEKTESPGVYKSHTEGTISNLPLTAGTRPSLPAPAYPDGNVQKASVKIIFVSAVSAFIEWQRGFKPPSLSPSHITVHVGDQPEKAMAPHSSTLAWKIPGTEEPGRLQSMGSLRVGHDWATSLSLFIFMHWRRKWQPTPVFLPGESQGRGSLVGCLLWGHTESDTTEAT